MLGIGCSRYQTRVKELEDSVASLEKALDHRTDEK
jgi:hypothetical protein